MATNPTVFKLQRLDTRVRERLLVVVARVEIPQRAEIRVGRHLLGAHAPRLHRIEQEHRRRGRREAVLGAVHQRGGRAVDRRQPAVAFGLVELDGVAIGARHDFDGGQRFRHGAGRLYRELRFAHRGRVQ